jgi:HEAT repeat protein
MAPARILVSVLALVSLAPAAAAQEEFDQEVRTLLDAGLKAYQQGKFDEAYAKFQEAFGKKPSSPTVYAFLRRAGQDTITGMINASDPRLQEAGRMLLALAKPGEAIRRDPKAIDDYLKELEATDSAVFLTAFWHLKNIGPYAVSRLIPVLGEDTADLKRPRVMLLLTEMHYDAELALIQALRSQTILMRQNAAILLGNIRGERALPYLKRMVEDPNEKPEVKRYVVEALAKITGRSPAEWRPAEQYFMELAEKYYYAHPTTVLRWQPNDLIWGWDAAGQAVTQRDVPAFAFNEQMCEEVLFDLLETTPNHAGAWSLLAANHFAQVLEADANLAAAERAAALGDIQADVVDGIKKLMAGADRGRVLGNIVNRPYLYGALARSLRDGRSEVAAAVLEALGPMVQPQDLPPAGVHPAQGFFGAPLIEALTADHQRVRAAAARVLLGVNPQFRIVGMDLVIPALVDALGEQGIRTVLVVHEAQTPADQQWINATRRMLRRLNTHPTIATSLPEALTKITAFPREDLILLQESMAARVVFQEAVTRRKVEERFFTQLKSDVRTKEIPVVLICRADQKPEELKTQYPDAVEIMPENADSTVVEKVLAQIADAMGPDAKNRADRSARAAAEALAALDVPNTMYPYLQARDALIGAAGLQVKRPEAIRLPAIRALGRFGDAAAIDTLAAALKEAGDPKEIRLAAAQALGNVLRVSGAAPSPAALAMMTETLADTDLDIAVAAANALGNATLTLEQRRELEKLNRLKRGAAGP